MSKRPGFVSASGDRGRRRRRSWACLAWVADRGPALFSPGALNAQAKGQTLGGVTSHAQLAELRRLSHRPLELRRPWPTGAWPATPTSRSQIQGHSGLHGGLVGALSSPTCGGCHTEHHGPNGALTANFNHNRFPFKLTGKHASVPCKPVPHAAPRPSKTCGTHLRTATRATPRTTSTTGLSASSCGQCHSTSSWADAKFDHKIFPVDHGTDKQASTCTTCHPSDFNTYTCYGCHQHTTASVQADHEGQNVAALADCIRCHPGGRAAGN